MSDASTRLALPLIAAAQAQKHVTHNEAILRLDGLVQMTALSYSTSAQPSSPADGDLYLLPAGKTGSDWGSYANYAVAHYYDGVWHQYHPNQGWLCYVQDSGTLYVYDGSSWSSYIPAYEQGSWTPGISFGGGATDITYSIQSGRYTLIGNRVLFSGYVKLSSKGSSTGSAAITGLPYAGANIVNLYSPCAVWANALASSVTGTLQSYVNVNSTSMLIQQFSTGNTANLNQGHFNDTTDFMVSGSYQKD